MTKRAAAYVRLSRESEESTSLARQREICEGAIKARGFAFDPETDLYVDNNLSGYKENVRRPAYDALIADLAQYDAVVVWRLDRLHRRIERVHEVLLACKEAGGVELVSTSESLDTSTPMGRGIAGFIAAQAEQESANTSARVRSSKEWLARHGYWGGPAPFGYQAVPAPDGSNHRVLEPKEGEADALREAAQRVIAGESASEVAHWLGQSHEGPRGTRWHTGTLLKRLRSPSIAGYRTYHGEVVRNAGEPVTVATEPVLDPTTWRNVVAVLEGRSFPHTSTSRTKRGALLSGLLVCGACGARPMTLNRFRRGNVSGHNYVCQGGGRQAPRTCPGNSISGPPLEELVIEQLFTYATPALIAKLRAEARVDDAAEELHRQADDLRAIIEEMHADRRDGVYAGEEGRTIFRTEMRRLTERLDAVRARIERAEAKGIEADPFPILGGEERIEEAWAEATDAERRTIVGLFIEEIVIERRATAGCALDQSFAERVAEVRWASS